MHNQTEVLIRKLLEECLEQEYTVEEVRSKIREALRMLDGEHGTRVSADFQSESV